MGTRTKTAPTGKAAHFIREWRKARGMTQEQLAEAIGAAVSSISQLETGKQGYSQSTLEAIARALTTSTAELLTERPSAGSIRKNIEIGLPIMGTVQAGNLRDITLVDENFEPEILMAPKDQRFKHASQYALKVEGDSMDLEFPDGCYVTVVDFPSSGLELKPGHVVHVERYLGGAQHVETTLKEIQSINGQILLVPKSTNPKHQPIVVTGDDDTEIKIRGIVTGKWEPKKL